MTNGTYLLRIALLALLGLAVISGSSFGGGDLFDADYRDCPARTRLRAGQISDLAVARDAEEEDEVNVSWAATEPATWGLGSNAYSTSLVVLLDDGGDLKAKTLSLGTRQATFADVDTDEVTVQMAIVVDAADGNYLISDILEASGARGIPAPSFMHPIEMGISLGFIGVDIRSIANSAFYYVGYNENFGNYKADGLLTRPSTPRLRIGLTHTGVDEVEDPLERFLAFLERPGVDVYADFDFDSYRMRITDEGGDVIPGADNVATVVSRFHYGATVLNAGSFTGTGQALSVYDDMLSNVRINDGGKISVAIHNLSNLPFTANPVTPSNQGLSIVEVGQASQAVFTFPPDEHRDFPIDTLTSDETYKIAAWGVNDNGDVISPVTSRATEKSRSG